MKHVLPTRFLAVAVVHTIFFISTKRKTLHLPFHVLVLIFVCCKPVIFFPPGLIPSRGHDGS